jgi:hypothetical protein
MGLMKQARINYGFTLKARVRVACCKFKDGSRDDFFMDMEQGILVCKKG